MTTERRSNDVLAVLAGLAALAAAIAVVVDGGLTLQFDRPPHPRTGAFVVVMSGSAALYASLRGLPRWVRSSALAFLGLSVAGLALSLLAALT